MSKIYKKYLKVMLIILLNMEHGPISTLGNIIAVNNDIGIINVNNYKKMVYLITRLVDV